MTDREIKETKHDEKATFMRTLIAEYLGHLAHFAVGKWV